MVRRVTSVDILGAIAVLFGLIAVFVPWYAYSTATTHVSVNGFRASLLGDLFYLAVVTTAVVLLLRWGIAGQSAAARIDTRTALTLLAAVVAGSVLVQIVLDAATHGRSFGPGLALALVAAAVMVVAAWLVRAQRRHRYGTGRVLEEDRLD